MVLPTLFDKEKRWGGSCGGAMFLVPSAGLCTLLASEMHRAAGLRFEKPLLDTDKTLQWELLDTAVGIISLGVAGSERAAGF
jgi:hypothetical protein